MKAARRPRSFAKVLVIDDARPAHKRDRSGGSFRDDEMADGSVQLMAQRQFVVSLVVAFALLAAAGLKMAMGSHENSAGMAARPQIMDAQTPHKTLAQPRPGMIPG
jgi:hypothetical protein